jgi:hypothetical protein
MWQLQSALKNIRENAEHLWVPFLLWLALVGVVFFSWIWLAPRVTCAMSGGQWIRDGIFGQAQYCLQSYSDGGAPCTQSSDCQGACMLDGPISQSALNSVNSSPLQGSCKRNNGRFGCFTYIERPTEGWCID